MGNVAFVQDQVLEAFCAEAGELSRAAAELSDAEWDRPTRCAPWSVRDLVAHIRVAIGWVPGMLSALAPERAEVSAAQYYRADQRFATELNAARVALAQDHAASQVTGAALAEDFAVAWQQVARLCRQEPVRRVVRTRHGDAMLLSDFMVTRVVEIAVHGLDIADALRRRPWLTRPAADLVQELLLGPGWATATAELGWNPERCLRKATGREPLSVAETRAVNRLGIRWLTLG